MIETRTTLTIPERALAAAESLARALYDLNIADGRFADGNVEAPYGATQAALRNVLEHMVADYSAGDMDERAEAFASFVIDQFADNGENVQYQITQNLGWTLVLVPAPHEDVTEPRTIPGNPSNYRHLAPSILGGDR